MQSYLWLVFVSVTSQEVFAHAPVSAFDIDFPAVDIEIQHRHADRILHCFVAVFPDSERYFPRIRNLAVHMADHIAGVHVRVTITVRPPQARVVNHKLGELLRSE